MISVQSAKEQVAKDLLATQGNKVPEGEDPLHFALESIDHLCTTGHPFGQEALMVFSVQPPFESAQYVVRQDTGTITKH